MPPPPPSWPHPTQGSQACADEASLGRCDCGLETQNSQGNFCCSTLAPVKPVEVGHCSSFSGHAMALAADLGCLSVKHFGIMCPACWR